MPPTIDHNDATLSIYTMVRNRLPFIADTPTNTTLVSHFTLEIMNQLEVCFRVAENDYTQNPSVPVDPADPGRIGHEENYTVLMQSIIADLVSVFILLLNASPTTTSSSSSNGTFLKKAKAGSVEVEYDQLDSSQSQSSVTIGEESLLRYYKKSAINRAAQLGCTVDICDDCSLLVSQQTTIIPPAFITFGSGCCGCGS